MKYRIILLLSMIILLIVVIRICSYSEVNKEYTPENWNKSPIANRLEMAVDMVNNNLLLGISYNDILTQLGEKGLSKNTKKNIEYIIGNNIMDHIYLLIQFDEAGYVNNASIYPS